MQGVAVDIADGALREFLRSRAVIEAYDPSDDIDAVLMAFLNYSSEVISIPYIAYLIGRLVLTHERATPFVLEIDDYGFSFNTNVKSLVLPNKVERIGQGAFNHFDACERFELPASLTNYGPTPFSNCNSLQEMINHAAEPPVLNDELFNDESLYSTVTLFVPAGSKEAYDNANIWQKFIYIEEMPVSSVDGVRTIDSATVVGIYTIDGKRLSQMQPGVNIVRMSDGTSRKVIK